MKKMLQSLIGMMLAIVIVSPVYAQQNKQASLKTMTWTTKSEAAKALALAGSDYFMNIELPQAYEKFREALKLDPNFTVALVFMVHLTEGTTKKDYAERALKSAANKTEGEKLFASLVKEGVAKDVRSDTWAKLYAMFPDGAMIGNYYVVTRATPEERFKAAEEYIAKFPKAAWMHNTIGYYYMMDKKDRDNAKKHFEKYIELYPDGYNPYDSMGEYYVSGSDMANAKKYYTIAVERYPFSSSSVAALEKIKESDLKQASNQK